MEFKNSGLPFLAFATILLLACGACRPEKEREKDLDNSITIITTVLAEVSDGGEELKKLQQAIETCSTKLKQYKAKMSDPEASVKNQEAYMNLVNKFKTSTDGLIKGSLAVILQGSLSEQAGLQAGDVILRLKSLLKNPRPGCRQI